MKVFIRHHASSLIDTFKSVAAAFFGVQSNKTRKRDFSQGRLSHFVVVGIIYLFLIRQTNVGWTAKQILVGSLVLATHVALGLVQ